MRALLALLLLANLGFLALSRGWLEPYVGLSTQHEREPQRLAAQVNPGAVRVLSVGAGGSALAGSAIAGSTSSSTPGAALCLQAGPFTAEQIDTAEAALAPALWPGLVARRVDDTAAASATASASGSTASAMRAGSFWLRVDPADAVQRERLLGLAPGALGVAPGSTPNSGFAPCPRSP